MKIRQILMNSLLAGTLAISQSLFLSEQEPAQAQSTRPYIVLVNGYQNCCAWSVADSLPQNAEIRSVPYSNFSDGGSSGNTSDDSAFLRDGADFINNQLDKNRPLILIGHSFGGDSVLKLLPRINRRIQFVAVIDPVRTGGFRASLKALNVPSNVDYFFNRWQENVPFPNDFGINGSILCNARTCDQDSQNIARNADFSPVTTECRWDEVTCPGFVAPNPFIGRKGRKGTKQVRVSHQDLPKDAFIQKDLGNKIQRQIAAFSPSDSGGDNTIVLPPITPRPGSQDGSSSSPSNRFRIRNRWNPSCLASIGNSQSMDNRVGMGTCDSSNSIWQWDGQQIRNGWNPNCLGSIGNSKEIDNPVVMGACGQSNAVWQWGGQQIKNGWNPFCLGSIGNSKAVDNPVVMGACGQSNAEWFIEPI